MKTYIFRYKILLILSIVFAILGSVMHVSIALVIQNIVDTAVSNNQIEFIKNIIYGIVFFVVISLIDYIGKFIKFKYLKNTIISFKEDIFKGILSLDYKSFNNGNSAEYISNLTNDVNLIESNYIVPHLDIISDIVIFIGTIVVLMRINIWITIAMFVSSALLFIIPGIFGKPTSIKQGFVSKELGKFTVKIKDIFEGYEVIKTYSVEENMTKQFLFCNNNVENFKFNVRHIQSISESISIFLSIMIQISAIAIGGYFLMKGRITVGNIFAIIQLGNGMFRPIMNIISRITMIKGMEHIKLKLLYLTKENNSKEKKSINQFRNSIEFNNVSFSYNDENISLDKISTKFEKNKKYVIVGKSGSGKSTLLKLLMGYYDNFNGNISIDGYNFKEIYNDSISKLISFVHQNVYMFDATIKENILLGKEVEDKEINNAIEKSGVHEFSNGLSKGVDSLVGEGGNRLSGGQKQRVAIARALIQRTPIILLDECTSSLDNKTAYEIEDKLLDIKELTIITVTHKLTKEVLCRYDEIIVMNDGKIVEKGNFYELIRNQSEFYNLYNASYEKETLSDSYIMDSALESPI